MEVKGGTLTVDDLNLAASTRCLSAAGSIEFNAQLPRCVEHGRSDRDAALFSRRQEGDGGRFGVILHVSFSTLLRRARRRRGVPLGREAAVHSRQSESPPRIAREARTVQIVS